MRRIRLRRAMDYFFKESTLVALRELAMRETAHEVELRLVEPAPQESILFLVTEDPATAALIRRAKRVADYLDAECYAVYLRGRDDSRTRGGETPEFRPQSAYRVARH